MGNKIINIFGNKETLPNKNAKYSELLEQFMSSFAHKFKDFEYIEDIFDFTINAWNFGNIKVHVSQEQFGEMVDIPQEDDVDIILLHKMIDYKASKFKKYTNFIIDYELKESDNGDQILTVVTQDEIAYLENILSKMEEEKNLHSQYDFEENYINRSAIILKPQQPFIDWHNRIYPDSEIDTTDFEETNIYLIDDEIEDIEKWLRKKFDKFFMMELSDYHNNKKEWPQRRNYKMFKEWFRVETSEMIYDFEKRPVEKDE